MKSMTGYANAYRGRGSQSLRVVLRSTNFKYLDIFIYNLEPEQIALEEKIKREIKKTIFRGKVEVYVFLKRDCASEVKIDENTLAKYVFQAKRLAKKYNLETGMRIEEFLKLPQVILWEEKKYKQENLVLPVVKEAVKKLQEFKEKEGKVIKEEMLKNLQKLKANVMNIRKNKPEAFDGDNNKEDIDEEISLAAFYIQRVAKKIHSKNSEPKGRPLDFLTQEILRELNAASSKTKRKDVSSLIVESKNYLERIREQAQNIE